MVLKTLVRSRGYKDHLACELFASCLVLSTSLSFINSDSSFYETDTVSKFRAAILSCLPSHPKVIFSIGSAPEILKEVQEAAVLIITASNLGHKFFGKLQPLPFLCWLTNACLTACTTWCVGCLPRGESSNSHTSLM